jgi:hypothetical protein
MDAASILVLILIAGVAALLMWFELNSRRNDAINKRSNPAPTVSDMSQKENSTRDSERHKAA